MRMGTLGKGGSQGEGREEAAEPRVDVGGAHEDSCSAPSIPHLDICSGKGVTRGRKPQKAQVKTVFWWKGTQRGKDGCEEQIAPTLRLGETRLRLL